MLPVLSLWQHTVIGATSIVPEGGDITGQTLGVCGSNTFHDSVLRITENSIADLQGRMTMQSFYESHLERSTLLLFYRPLYISNL